MSQIIELTPEQTRDMLSAFGDDEGPGLVPSNIIVLMAHLVRTGAITMLDDRYQKIASGFITSGIIDFSGTILISEEELIEEDDNMGFKIGPGD